jgi:hypothetical protein
MGKLQCQMHSKPVIKDKFILEIFVYDIHPIALVNGLCYVSSESSTASFKLCLSWDENYSVGLCPY